MNTQSRKDRLIEYILNLQDNNLLDKFESLLPKKQDWANELSEQQRQGIIDAKKQIQEGKTLSSDEVWSRFNAKFRQ